MAAAKATIRKSNPGVTIKPSSHEITASSWGNLQDLLFDGSWNPTINRHRSRHAFRGNSNVSHKLEPGLMRIGGEYWTRERHLFRNFKKYAHRNVVEQDSFWHWLSVAQHHGLPTRLLDWTYSPLVAMHFATSNLAHFGIDGCVWKVDYDQIHKHLPNGLRKTLADEGAQIFTVDLLDKTARDLPALDSMPSDLADFVIFFEPPSIDDRIVNQFAYFSVASNPQLVIDDWLMNVREPNAWTKIIIPATLKWEIRDKLDQANLSERVLFPGLDGLTQWLKRHYTKRP
jgi:FRG domain